MKWKSALKLAQKHVQFLQVGFIIITGIILYAPCSGGGFVWDDHGLIKDNAYIKDWSFLPKVINSSFGAGGQAQSGFYRPLQTVLHMLGYSWWGLNPAGYHLTSILVHILAAIVFYFFFKELFPTRKTAFLAGLLFLCFPANTEAVCYISGLSDPLSLLFILTSVIFYLKSCSAQNKGWLAASLLSFICALFSKENVAVLPLLILLYHYAFGKKLSVKKFVLFCAILAGYFIWRPVALISSGQAIITPAGLWERFPVFFAGIAQYLRLLLLPLDLHLEYASRSFKFSDPQAALGLALAILLVIFALIKRKKIPGYLFRHRLVLCCYPASEQHLSDKLFLCNGALSLCPGHWLFYYSCRFTKLFAEEKHL